jgi:hypothetical protein
MKRVSYLLIVLVMLTVTVSVARAQGTGPPPPPPPCCTKEGSIAPGTPSASPITGTEESGILVSVTDDTLGLLGLTRSEFVDRLMAGLFPGRSVDVLITSTDLVNPELAGDTRGRLADPDGSVTVEIRRTYRIPRFRVAQAIFDTTDHFVLTDGTVLVTVQFRRSSEQGLNVR